MFNQALRTDEVVDGQELCLLDKLLKKNLQKINIKRSFMSSKKSLKSKMKMVHTILYHINLIILEMKKKRLMKKDRSMIMMRMMRRKKYQLLMITLTLSMMR